MQDFYGVLPWLSIEAGASEIVIAAHFPYPTRQAVDRCMNCPFAECRDCMGRMASGRPRCRPVSVDTEKIRRLVREGYTNREIVEAMGCSRSTVQRYKREFSTRNGRATNYFEEDRL